MPDRYCVFNSQSNYDNGPIETVFFFFPDEKKDYDNRHRGIRFVNRKGWKPPRKLCICQKHFELHYYKTGAKRKRYRLVKNLRLVLTIFDTEESHLLAKSKYLRSPVSVPRKLPTKRVYQQDQFKLFEEQGKIKSFDDIASTLTTSGYTFQKSYVERPRSKRLCANRSKPPC